MKQFEPFLPAYGAPPYSVEMAKAQIIRDLAAAAASTADVHVRTHILARVRDFLDGLKP